MLSSVAKFSLLFAGASGLALTDGAVQDQLEALRQQLSRMPVSSDPASAVALAVSQWKALQQSDRLSFESYANFLIAHPGWPGELSRRRAAEGAIDPRTASPSLLVSYFRRYPPLTAVGQLRYAEALQTIGSTGDATEMARAAWRRGVLPAADEAAALTNFGAVLTAADHDARMDALLWAGATASAQRQLGLTSGDKRAMFAARLALRTRAPDAGAQDAVLGDRYLSDAGYLADRALWLKNGNRWQEARALLARPHALTPRPADVGAWYDLLLANARGAAADAQYQLAFDIARQVDDAYPAGTDVSQRPYDERDAYTDLVWLAGQTALKTLGRPLDAVGMFDRYGRGAQSPTTRAKGFYWAGRAALAAGRADQAAMFFERAAAYRDLYYGQLAAEKLGRALTPPPPLATAAVDPTLRAAFYQRETVQAARYLGTIGAHQDQTAFIRQIAADATTESDHLLAAELSRGLGRPDLGVLVGRSALQNGLTDYTAAGYPSVRVPEGAADRWTMIHAIARQESQFDRAAVSRAGARGLMQLLPGTAREQAMKLGLGFNSESLTSDPEYNVQLGSAYFQRLYNNYGSYPLAVAAYNAGAGNVNKWLAANGDPRTGAIDPIDWVEAIPFSETRNYVQRVLENAVVYDLLNPERSRSMGNGRISWYLGRRPG